jgi:PPOX class probable F420-dependent enzyme
MNGLSQFAGEKYLNLETFRKSGEAVRTPVWFVQSNDILYIRTASDTGKYKRIRNNKSVRIAPCDMRGKVKGEWVSAEAKIADEDEAQKVYKMLEKKYGMMYKMSRTFLGSKNYVVITIRIV